MEDKKEHKMVGYYDYTVILTYCGMLSAVAGIFCAIGEKFLASVMCLMVAGICDMFDGAVASTKIRTVSEKRFGIQIDSLSDLISFGVLPGMFVYCFSGRSITCAVISALFILCALIRLAYFNVLEEERQQKTPEKPSGFLGIPVTTIAVILPAVYLLTGEKENAASVALQIMLGVTAAGYITPVEISKPKKAGKLGLMAVGLAEMAGIIRMLIR